MKRFLPLVILLLTVVLVGFRPFHFYTNEESAGRWSSIGDGGTWTFSSSGEGFIRHNPTGGDDVLKRNTDLATNQTVEARLRDDSSVAFPGVAANITDGDNYYLANLDDSGEEIQLWTQVAGVWVQIGGFSQTIFTATYYRLKLTTQTDGLNKILNVYLDGVLKIGPVTTATLISGQAAGIYAGGNDAFYDWWTFNTNMAVGSVSPATGSPAGGTAVTVVGTDFGDAMTVRFGAGLATGVTLLDLTAGTTVAVGSPAGSGSVAVSVYFGTAGSEEYSGGGASFDYFTMTSTPTISATSTDSPTSTWTPTATPTFTDSPTFTSTPTFTATPTSTPTHTPTNFISSTLTLTFTDSGTFTVSPTVSATKTVTPTHSPEDSVTPTFTFTVTPTFTVTKTFSLSPTFSVTKTVTPTGTDTITETPTFTWSGTISPTPTQTEILTTKSPSPTASASRTRTPVVATLAASKTPTTSATVTRTRTPSPTATPTKTISFTKTRSPVIASKTRTRTFTPQSTPTFTRTPTP